MRGVRDSQSTLNSSPSAFLPGAKVFILDKRGRHREGLRLIRSSQSGGHDQSESGLLETHSASEGHWTVMFGFSCF